MAKNMNNDSRIEQMLERIASKKEEIFTIEKYSPQTNMTIEVNGIRKNLNAISDLNELCKIWAYIKSETDQLLAAAFDLGDVKIDFNFQGYSRDKWFDDIKARVKKVLVYQERESLKKMELTLESLMSNDLKVDRELSKIEKMLESTTPPLKTTGFVIPTLSNL